MRSKSWRFHCMTRRQYISKQSGLYFEPQTCFSKDSHWWGERMDLAHVKIWMVCDFGLWRLCRGCVTTGTPVLPHTPLKYHTNFLLQLYQLPEENILYRARIFKLWRSPCKNRFRRTSSARLSILACRYDIPIPTRFLAPIDCLKIPARYSTVCMHCKWWKVNFCSLC